MRLAIPALLACAILAAGVAPAAAEDSWNPFATRDAERARKGASTPAPGSDRPFLPPMDGRIDGQPAQPPSVDQRSASPQPPSQPANGYVTGSQLPPLTSKDMAVERGDLAPVMASDGSSLPLELWQGLDLARIEQLLATLDIPPRSPAAHDLWRRLVTSNSVPPSADPAKFALLRAEALYRSGLLKQMAGTLPAAPDDPVATLLKVRADIALADTAAGCAGIKSVAARKLELQKRMRGEALLLAGYCAAAGGAPGGAGLAADLAREEGYDAPFALAALDALAVAQKPRLAPPKRLTVLDYRLLHLLGAVEPAAVLASADAPLLAALIADTSADPKLRLAAAEAGARMNVLDPAGLADIYRAQSFTAAELADPLAGRPDPLLRRALLFRSIEAERTPLKRARAIRALLDDSRRNGTYLHGLRMLAKAMEDLQRVHEIGWFAETAIEIAVASSRLDLARDWVAFSRTLHRPDGSSLDHWLALVDIADPDLKSKRGQSLASVEELALRGRFAAELLHKLATVLDALDYNVPIPLWDAANRTPQPTGGHLPETGVLPELLDASKKKEFGRTVLLTLRTLGPNGAEGAHMIALGDSIRALKRAGLESDARRLAFEALFAGWPRTVSN